MKSLRLDLFQQTACYKKPFAIKISETYPLPPYSTVNGLIHRILDAKEYIPLNISIQGSYESIIHEYQTIYFYKKDTVTKMPMNQHLLLNVKLIVHINAEDKILNQIYDKLKNLDEFLSLGRKEDLLRIDNVQIVDVNEYEIDDDYEELEDFQLATYYLKYPIYIPKKYNVDAEGIHYRLNNYYKETRNKWEKIDVLFADKGVQFTQGRILLDEKKDIVFFNNL